MLLQHSSRDFVKMVCAPTDAEQALMASKKANRFKGIVGKFVAQLSELASIIGGSNPSFIRCIKPNAQLQPIFQPATGFRRIGCCSGSVAAAVAGSAVIAVMDGVFSPSSFTVAPFSLA